MPFPFFSTRIASQFEVQSFLLLFQSQCHSFNIQSHWSFAVISLSKCSKIFILTNFVFVFYLSNLLIFINSKKMLVNTCPSLPYIHRLLISTSPPNGQICLGRAKTDGRKLYKHLKMLSSFTTYKIPENIQLFEPDASPNKHCLQPAHPHSNHTP